MLCPDCGGVIGIEPGEGQMRCMCKDASAPAAHVPASEASVKASKLFARIPSIADEDEEDMSGLTSDSGDTQVTSSSSVIPPKICCQCGVDVNGKKRAKDSRGYWCYECYKEDLRKERAAKKGDNRPKGRCNHCGRMVPVDSLITRSGLAMCAKCRLEEEESGRKRYKPVGTTSYSASEKRSLMLSFLGIVVLGTIILLAHFHVLPTLNFIHFGTTQSNNSVTAK